MSYLKKADYFTRNYYLFRTSVMAKLFAWRRLVKLIFAFPTCFKRGTTNINNIGVPGAAAGSIFEVPATSQGTRGDGRKGDTLHKCWGN